MKESPCKNCSERDIACSGHCPKDARGEYGYKAWYHDYKEEEAAMDEYKKRRREDFIRSVRINRSKGR